MASHFQNQLRAQKEPTAPITLPRFTFKEPDIEREAKEAAVKTAR